MKFKYFYVWYALALLITAGCSESKTQNTKVSSESEPRIVIYGSNNCSHCVDFKAELDKRDIDYKFNDVEFSDPLTREMLDVVNRAGITGRIDYPVVVVDGNNVLISPEVERVLTLMN